MLQIRTKASRLLAKSIYPLVLIAFGSLNAIAGESPSNAQSAADENAAINTYKVQAKNLARGIKSGDAFKDGAAPIRQLILPSSSKKTIGAVYDGNKTINGKRKRVYTISGWDENQLTKIMKQYTHAQLEPWYTNDWAKKIGYRYASGKKGFAPDGFTDEECRIEDDGVWYNTYEGTGNASHAEIQAIKLFQNAQAIGFAKKPDRSGRQTMCKSCRKFLHFYAKQKGHIIVVSSPTTYYIFGKNGDPKLPTGIDWPDYTSWSNAGVKN